MRFPAHLHNVLAHISSWMTASRLTLNSSKTEFLFIGLKQKLGKIHNTSLNAETQQNQQKYLKIKIILNMIFQHGGAALWGPIFFIFGMRGYTPT